jgi:hypothetical protein
MRGPTRKTPDKSSGAREAQSSRLRGKSHAGSEHGKKMLINCERTRNVYENKQKADDLPDEKDDTST